jgi:hypothetical protein
MDVAISQHLWLIGYGLVTLKREFLETISENLNKNEPLHP